MSRQEGLLTVTDLEELIGEDVVDTVLVMFTDAYGRLMGKRYDASFFLDQVLTAGAHACDYLMTVDMEMEPIQGYTLSNWELGYGDFHLKPDLGTLRRATWQDGAALVLCDVLDPKTHQAIQEVPRNLLKTQIDRLSSHGLGAKAGSELEYYVFHSSYKEAAQRGYAGLNPSGTYIEDYHMLQGTRHEPLNRAVRRHLRNSGIPVENSKGEWGVGQHELNIQYADVLEMSDRHALYKQCLKEVADSLGWSVTFMAKLDEAQAGSSCHVHLSLWDGQGNAFDGDHSLGPVLCSDVFRWFLAGWISHAPEMMVFYAPTVNSYKRYQAGSWAPTRLAWSHDNRTAGFRVVGKDSSLRIECRIPGADCNPYLVYAAAIASGLDGIEKKMNPPEMFDGDAYSAKALAKLPMTLKDATRLFEESSFAREAFGSNVVDHYAHFFRTEQTLFEGVVTDWEKKRYFERI